MGPTPSCLFGHPYLLIYLFSLTNFILFTFLLTLYSHHCKVHFDGRTVFQSCTLYQPVKLYRVKMSSVRLSLCIVYCKCQQLGTKDYLSNNTNCLQFVTVVVTAFLKLTFIVAINKLSNKKSNRVNTCQVINIFMYINQTGQPR